jgi:hypothetical protein
MNQWEYTKYIFMYDLFIDALIIPDYILSNGTIRDEWWIVNMWKVVIMA